MIRLAGYASRRYESGRWKEHRLPWERIPEVVHNLPKLKRIVVDEDHAWEEFQADLDRLEEKGVEIFIRSPMRPMQRLAFHRLLDKLGPCADLEHDLDLWTGGERY
jgi:hypothetical protein